MDHSHSASLYGRATQALAGGVSSNVRSSGPTPVLYFQQGFGSRVRDVDGNEYIDYVLGQGPMFLGYGVEEVREAVIRALDVGQSFAAGHPLEVELAEIIQRLSPCAELVRFNSSGSEAVQGALRIARAATGRARYVKFEGHYHGWFDSVMYSLAPTPEQAGLPDRPNVVRSSGGQFPGEDDGVIVLPWNDLAALSAVLDDPASDIAAVLMEPIMCNTGVMLPDPGYLAAVRDLCTRRGVVLIFDEVITGFRVALGGAQELFGVTPDLVVYGKAFASGFPMSVVAGRRDLMEPIARHTVNHAGTLNGNAVCAAAAIATLKVLERDAGRIYPSIAARSVRLMNGLREIGGHVADQPLLVQGVAGVFYAGFATDESASTGAPLRNYRDIWRRDQVRYGQLVNDLLDEGVRVIGRGVWYVSAAHTDADVDATLEAVRRVLAVGELSRAG